MLFNSMAFSQTTDSLINGAIGLKFGMSQSKVKTIIQSKGGILDKTSNQEFGICLTYKKLRFLSNDVYFTHFKFYKDSLFSITFCFIVDADGFTQAKYDALKEKIENKYGNGDCFRYFDSPYYDGDGYEMSAVSQGKAHISCIWTDINENAISLAIKESLLIMLEYQSTNLIDKVIKNVESKQMKDY